MENKQICVGTVVLYRTVHRGPKQLSILGMFPENVFLCQFVFSNEITIGVVTNFHSKA